RCGQRRIRRGLVWSSCRAYFSEGRGAKQRAPYNWRFMDRAQKLEELARRDAGAEIGGGPERRERQHREGKMSARERIDFLLDEGSFEETDKFITHRCTDFGMEQQK